MHPNLFIQKNHNLSFAKKIKCCKEKKGGPGILEEKEAREALTFLWHTPEKRITQKCNAFLTLGLTAISGSKTLQLIRTLLKSTF